METTGLFNQTSQDAKFSQLCIITKDRIESFLPGLWNDLFRINSNKQQPTPTSNEDLQNNNNNNNTSITTTPDQTQLNTSIPTTTSTTATATSANTTIDETKQPLIVSSDNIESLNNNNNNNNELTKLNVNLNVDNKTTSPVQQSHVSYS